MVELLGSGYVIEYCVTAFSKNQREKSYQVYITDCLKIISSNTAHIGGGAEINKRWIDLVDQPKITETRTGEEVMDDFKNRLNKLGKEV